MPRNYNYTETRQKHKAGTKTVFETTGESARAIDQTEFDNMTAPDCLKFFRRLGGSEYVERSYTSAGYIVTRLISRSPERDIKVIRTFEPVSNK